MDTLLNACGYFVAFCKDPSRPSFLGTLPNPAPDAFRFRLMQVLQPSQKLDVYASVSGNGWFTGPLATGEASPSQVAENVVALVILPKYPARDAGAPALSYAYDSRAGQSTYPQTQTQHQLPPLIEIVMVAIDDVSAKRLESGSTQPDLGIGALFSDATRLEDDLKALESALQSRRITYRVFRTTVALRNSKWSS
jgi:uncharacterized protein (TIGR02599 family)